MYGAAERIHWTNARVVAELACGAGFGFGDIGGGAAGAWGSSVPGTGKT